MFWAEWVFVSENITCDTLVTIEDVSRWNERNLSNKIGIQVIEFNQP